MARTEYPEYNEDLAKRKVEIIEQREEELEQLRPAYLEALKITKGRSDGKDVIDLARLLKTYQAGESPDKAIYILAQATMLVNKLVLPFAVVVGYTTKEQELIKLRK